MFAQRNYIFLLSHCNRNSSREGGGKKEWIWHWITACMMLSAARWWRTVHFYSRTTTTTISVGIYWGDILRKQDVILTQRGSAGSVFHLQVIMLLLCLSVQVHSAGWSKAGLKGWRWREFRIGFWKAVKWMLFISWMFLWFSLEQPIYYHNGFVFCYMDNFYNREFLFENDHRQESNLFIYSILSCNFKKKKKSYETSVNVPNMRTVGRIKE